MNLDFTTIEKQAQLLKEEQEKLEQKDHDFQLALDKHREALKDLFKELFHNREIKTALLHKAILEGFFSNIISR